MTLEEVRAMTPEEKRVMMAQLDGWEFKRRVTDNKTGDSWDVYAKGEWTGSIKTNTLPDYCNDLQAAHDVEATLTNEQQDAYIDRMIESIVIPFEAEYGVKLSDTDITWTVLHANANQRTTALILTLSTQR